MSRRLVEALVGYKKHLTKRPFQKAYIAYKPCTTLCSAAQTGAVAEITHRLELPLFLCVF